VRVPVVLTTASQWHALSMPLFLDFWGAFSGPFLAWLRTMNDPMVGLHHPFAILCQNG